MKIFFASLLGLLLSCEAMVADDDFSMDEFRILHSELVPRNAVWKTIPWQTDLLSAQRLAVERKQLIFIWAMDGHPLGCT